MVNKLQSEIIRIIDGYGIVLIGYALIQTCSFILVSILFGMYKHILQLPNGVTNTSTSQKEIEK